MRAESPVVLVVQREAARWQELERALRQQGLLGMRAATAAEVDRAVAAHRPALVLLDPRLGTEDGWQVFRELRRRGVPVLVLLSRPDLAMARLARELGADACLAGLDRTDELARQARLVLQQAGRPSAPLSYGGLVIEVESGQARINGRALALTPTECLLLAALAEARGRVVAREQLVARARATAAVLPLTRSIEAHIRSLRRKLGDDPAHPRLILAVRGFGYRLACPPEVVPAERLAEAALRALPQPTLVIDQERRVRLMNPAAEQFSGRTARAAVDSLSCEMLLRCDSAWRDCDACPASVARSTARPRQAALVLAPRGAPVPVRAVCSLVADLPGHVVIQVREPDRA